VIDEAETAPVHHPRPGEIEVAHIGFQVRVLSQRFEVRKKSIECLVGLVDFSPFRSHV